MAKNAKCFLIILSLATIWSSGLVKADDTNYKSVEPNRIPQILTLISEQIRSNYDSIKTWQGEADVTTDSIYEGAKAERMFKENTNGSGEIPEVVMKHIESVRHFAVDTERDILYTSLFRENPPAYTDLESGRNLGIKSPRPWYTSLIISSEYFIKCMPYTYDRGNSIAGLEAVKEIRPKGSACKSNMPPAFDPRTTFATGGKIWESFPRMLQYIHEHGKYSFGGYDLRVEESISENVTKYRIVIPNKSSSGKYHFFTKLFSSDVGFNMTSSKVVNEDGRILQEWDLAYDLIDGIYLPRTAILQNFTREDGGLSYKRRYVFKNQKVNKSIPAETFSHKNLGLKNGDKFIDKIEGKEYKYEDTNLIFVADLPASANGK